MQCMAVLDSGKLLFEEAEHCCDMHRSVSAKRENNLR